MDEKKEFMRLAFEQSCSNILSTAKMTEFEELASVFGDLMGCASKLKVRQVSKGAFLNAAKIAWNRMEMK